MIGGKSCRIIVLIWRRDISWQNATARLPADKAVTRQDAEGVMSAEMRNNPNLATHPGGVASSVAAAARLNESVV